MTSSGGMTPATAPYGCSHSPRTSCVVARRCACHIQLTHICRSTAAQRNIRHGLHQDAHCGPVCVTTCKNTHTSSHLPANIHTYSHLPAGQDAAQQRARHNPHRAAHRTLCLGAGRHQAAQIQHLWRHDEHRLAHGEHLQPRYWTMVISGSSIALTLVIKVSYIRCRYMCDPCANYCRHPLSPPMHLNRPHLGCQCVIFV